MNAIKRLLPDIIVIAFFAVISFVYFCPAVTEGRILSQHDSVVWLQIRIWALHIKKLIFVLFVPDYFLLLC